MAAHGASPKLRKPGKVRGKKPKLSKSVAKLKKKK